MRQALFDLDNEGYIKLKVPVLRIEEEALDLAWQNKKDGVKTTEPCTGSDA